MVVLAACLLLAAPLAIGQETVKGSTLDEATFSVPSVWAIGKTLTVSGQGWTNIAGDRGSVIGVKYDQGSIVPDEPVHEMDDLWVRVPADADGSWSAELPYPDNAGWRAGETHSIHLLAGLLGNNDKTRNPAIRVTIIE